MQGRPERSSISSSQAVVAVEEPKTEVLAAEQGAVQEATGLLLLASLLERILLPNLSSSLLLAHTLLSLGQVELSVPLGLTRREETEELLSSRLSLVSAEVAVAGLPSLRMAVPAARVAELR
jgi:hypothetical protein